MRWAKERVVVVARNDITFPSLVYLMADRRNWIVSASVSGMVDGN